MRVLEDNIKVSQLMSQNLVVGSLSNKFSQILEFFTSFQMHHLPIVDNGELKGVISYTDILKFIGQFLLNNQNASLADLDNVFTVSDIMTKNVITINTEALIDDAVEILAGNTFQSLPVVNEDKKLVGILSNKDIVRFYNEY